MPKQTRQKTHEHERAPETAELHFVLCDHSVSNYERILDAVERAHPDMIAVELAGEDDLSRFDMESEVNRQLAGHEPGEFAEDIGWLEEDIIARFRGEGIRYVAIDADLDSEGGQLVAKANSNRVLYEKYHDDTSPAAAAFRRHYAEQYIDTTVRGDIIREEVMADQLEELADKYPGKRIAVIIGMVHDGVADDIDDDIPVSRVYVPKAADEERLSQGERGRFTRYELGQRALALGTMNLSEVMAFCLDEDGRFIGYNDE